MRTLIVVGVLAVCVGSSTGCVIAHTPDGKTYSCLRHTKPTARGPGIATTLYGADGSEYDCLGPHKSDMPLAQGGALQAQQKSALALKSRPSTVVAGK